MNNKDFYNSLSLNYDLMINFEKSLKNKTESLRNFVEKQYNNALDIGCGTGVDSIALSELGLKVDAVDQSNEMLKLAKLNAQKRELNINFFQSKTDAIPLTKRYDLIISLGNTIANISNEELEILFKKLPIILNKNGKIIIQILNFSSLPKSGYYLLNKYENDNIQIIRKYLIKGNNIDFIIEINSAERKETIVTKIFPYSLGDFEKLTQKNDLTFNKFGNLRKDIYSPINSKNLIIEIQKKNSFNH
ncbi:MAG: hypothetical protein CR986_08250 [Ignavibacteriae bacterium]|nr:MAG: hypothetical protein CR986_08250 [Ignavibacteriota bacterium]